MSSDTALDVFDRRESEVRGYIRSFPTVFDRAIGSTLVDADGREYLDFFAGAGVLNYGHNNPVFTRALIEYLERDGIIHGLDMATSAKRAFIEAFERLRARAARARPQAAVHRADRRERRRGRPQGGPPGDRPLDVVAFTNAFHGLSLGALAATGNSHYRGAAGVGLDDVARLPYDGYLGADVDTLDLLEKMLDDPAAASTCPPP